MNVHALVHDRIVAALQAVQDEGILPDGLGFGDFDVEPLREAGRGDLASNAALVLARQAGLQPREIAARVAEKLRAHADIETAAVAGAGFLNMRFTAAFWHAALASILKAGSAYGRAGRGGRIVVKAAIAKPAVPLHAGHGRTAVFADALANLLEFAGHAVTREFAFDESDAGGLATVAAGLAALKVKYDRLRVEPDLRPGAVEVVGGSGQPRGKRLVGAVALSQRVRLLRGGEPVCARSGMRFRLSDLVAEVGRDPLRFMILYRKSEARLDLDLGKMIEQAKDNPVFDVQYAHARAKSIFRNAREIFPDLEATSAKVVDSDLSLLAAPGEIGLIKRLAAFPAIIDAAARTLEPHRVTFYLHDLASSFNAHYGLGNDLPHLRFIEPDNGTLTAARLALAQATAHVLALGLELLGVLAPSEMR